MSFASKAHLRSRSVHRGVPRDRGYTTAKYWFRKPFAGAVASEYSTTLCKGPA